MIRYQFFNNMAVDGSFYLEGILGLSTFPSAAAKQKAADYEYQIGKLLMEIAAYNWAGLAVIWAIADLHREILIVPDRKWESKGEENAHTVPEKYGTRVMVEFTPGSAGSLQCHSGQRAARRPAEILLHELVHGLRMGSGVWQKSPFGSGQLRLYGDKEEFLAILLTNIYMSELGRGPLRGQWITTPDDCDVLQGNLSTSTGFLENDLRLQILAGLCEWMPSLFRNVAQAKAAFNPVAEYLANKATYDARVRDSAMRPD